MGEVAKPKRLPDNGKARKEPGKVKPRRSGSWKRPLLLMLLLLVVSGGAAVGALYWQVNKIMEDVSQPASNDGVNTVKPGLGTVYQPDQSISMVIIGRDTRKNGGGMNTDVMMVAVINPVSKKVTMLSIPRDTRFKIAGTSGYEKINAVYAAGESRKKQAEKKGEKPTENGITLVKGSLEDVLGIPIHYYAEVDFKGFQDIVNELGGIKVKVDRKLVYDDPTDNTHINLKAGLQVLNGKQALDYVRHRHDNRGANYESSDYDRNRRQHEVIRSIADKMTTLDGMSKLLAVIKIAGDHFHTDMPPDKMKGIIADFKGLDSSSITTLENGAYWIGGPDMNYTFIPKDKLASIRTAMQEEMNIKPESIGKLNDSVTLGDKEKVQPVVTVPKQTHTVKEPEAKQPAVKKTTDSTRHSAPASLGTNLGNEPAPADSEPSHQEQQPGSEAPPADFAPQETPSAPPADYSDVPGQG